MQRVIGYIVAVVGLILMAVGFKIFDIGLDFLDGVSGTYVAGLGIVLIIIGVIISLKAEGGRRGGDGRDEVPIYEGTGKKRRVVGYRKD